MYIYICIHIYVMYTLDNTVATLYVSFWMYAILLNFNSFVDFLAKGDLYFEAAWSGSEQERGPTTPLQFYVCFSPCVKIILRTHT